MRTGRKYDKVVEVYQTSRVSDGFGGHTTSDVIVGTSFCNIRTLSAQNRSDLGLNTDRTAVEIKTRVRQDISYNTSDTFFVYDGNKININSIEPIGLNGLEYLILGTVADTSFTAPVI